MTVGELVRHLAEVPEEYEIQVEVTPEYVENDPKIFRRDGLETLVIQTWGINHN